MHTFRFVAALTLLVAISMVRIAIERDNLALHRAISLQHFRGEQLVERQSHLQLRVTELMSPVAQDRGEESRRPSEN